MNNDNQLTPEIIVEEFLNERYPHKGNFIEAIKRYATQLTAAKDEEIHQLKRWKEEQIKTFAPLLDYGQSKESGIPLGANIVEEAIKSLKEAKAKDERLKELEVQHNAAREYDNKVIQNRDARIAELENIIIDTSKADQSFRSDCKLIEKELLEKVEQLIEAREKDEQGYNEIILRLKADRDQAFDLLEEWVKVPLIGRLKYMRQKTASLLSSRENNKP